MPVEIFQIIHEKYHDKFKFITHNYLLKNVQKNFVESHINKFKILKVSFDQFLLKGNCKRSEAVFFLFNGEVEICEKIQENYNHNHNKYSNHNHHNHNNHNKYNNHNHNKYNNNYYY